MRRFLSIGEAMIEMSPQEGPDGVSWRMGVAGDTMNTAWYARALLGDGWRVSYFTALGTDRYSNIIRDFIAEGGIDTHLVGTVPDRRPGLYFIHQQDGDRHFTYWRETSAARTLADDLPRLRRATSDADIIYFSGITLGILDRQRRADFIGAVKAARSNGANIAFDPNIRPALWPNSGELRAALADAAALADTVLPTFGDEARLFGDRDIEATARRYSQLGATEVVVENGADATFVLYRNGSFLLSPPAVEQVVDATGAGDSFNGAYLASRAMGGAPDEAIRQAHRTAAVCISHPGALAPRPALSALRSGR